jgi:hypothetical protein
MCAGVCTGAGIWQTGGLRKRKKANESAVMRVLKLHFRPGTTIAHLGVSEEGYALRLAQAKSGDQIMSWLRRAFHVPASETQMGLVVALCIFTMSVMSIALVWQAQVIAKQNAVIHLLESKFGG